MRRDVTHSDARARDARATRRWTRARRGARFAPRARARASADVASASTLDDRHRTVDDDRR